MKIKGITDEDFINYKVPSMYIATATCSFKCDKEFGTKICQNGSLALQPTHSIDNDYLIERYRRNDITRAIVFGGLEPMDSFDDVLYIVHTLRTNWFDLSTSIHYIEGHIVDDVVIYTGYNKGEISEQIDELRKYQNVVVKYGRYIPGCKPHFDSVLGVYLASDNQYAERLDAK